MMMVERSASAQSFSCAYENQQEEVLKDGTCHNKKVPSSVPVSAAAIELESKAKEEAIVPVAAAKTTPKGTVQSFSDAKIRSEVIAPFRSFRMFFYGAFIASGSIGGLIAVIRLIGALNHAPGAEAPIEIAKGLGIDLAAVIIFALLYRSDAKAREIALAKLSREEDLANLRLQLDNKKVVTLAQLRGISRIVILAGPGSYIEEALKQSEPFKAALLERGVLLAPYATDGATLTVDSPAVAPIADVKPGADAERKWIAKPIYTSEWGRWINEQKRLANVSMEKPVYISLRLDGRVRGSGVGIPSWRAMSLQLPPLKGMWGGALDGMDGRV
ncbi:unnamed protein product [Sphagnum tenellum]